MATQGPFSPTTVTSIGSAPDLPWSSPENAGPGGVDGAYATINFTPAVSDEESEYLRAVDIPFVIAADATVQGLTVTATRRELGSDVRDLEMQLVYQGNVIGENKASPVEWPAVDGTIIYGGSSDLWDAALTPQILNDPTFGGQLRVTSQSGSGPQAQVDAMLFTASYLPAPASTGTGIKLRDRVRLALGELNVSRRERFLTIQIDNVIADAHMVVAALMPGRAKEGERALRLAEGLHAFTLPTAVSGRVSRLEYASSVRLRRARDGVFMQKVSMETMAGFLNGGGALRRGPPRFFTVWEDDDAGVSGLCYPRPDRDEFVNLFYRAIPDDSRDANDLDGFVFETSRQETDALVYLAAADLVSTLTREQIEQRRLSPHIAQRWRDHAATLIEEAAAEHYNLAGVGRTLRMVS